MKLNLLDGRLHLQGEATRFFSFSLLKDIEYIFVIDRFFVLNARVTD